MKKLRLLFAICALMVGGVSVVQAQTDVTSTYLTNPGFDGDFQRFFDINTDRGVEKPRGWSVEWYQDNNDKNGMTYNATSMTQDSKTWNAKSNKAYFARMRWGNAILYLRQTLQNLRPGDYTLSFSATAHSTNNNNSVKVSVAGETQTIASGSVSNENGNWTDYSINFTVTESTPYATIEFKAERKGDLLKIGIDEFKLMYDGSSYYNTILTKAQALYDDNKDWAEKGLSDFNSAITTNSGKSTVADKNEAIVAIENAMATFKADNSVDMTSRINNPNFDSNISGWTTTGGDGNAYGRQTSSQTNFTGGFLEKWRNSWNGSHNQANFDVYQALTNLPNGEYTVKAYILAQMQGSKETLDKDYKDKKHGGPYYIDNEKGVWFYATSGNNTNNVWANSFTPSFGDTSGGVLRSATVQVADGNLTIGFKGIGSQNGGNSLGTYANWIACDTWTLSYFGFDPSTLKAQISDLKNDVQDIIDGDEVPTALKTSLQSTLNNLVETPETKSVLDAAISTLQNAINNANSIKVAYAKVNAHIDFVTSEKTNSTGTKTTIEAAINTANTNKENCTTAEALEEVYNTLETARQTYVTSGAQPTADHVFDFTFKIPDAAVTSANDWTNKRTASDQQYTGAPDNTYFDNYNENRNIQKNIGVLLLGKYQLKCATRAHADVTVGNIYFSQNNANLNQTDINHVGNTGGDLGNGWSWTTVSFDNFDNSNDITLGFYSECGSSKWAGADDFHLYYKGNTVDDETATALLNTVETRKMNADVASAQTSAKTNFENQKTFDNYNALKAAIDAAKTSADNYAKVKAAIDEANTGVATLDDAGQAAYNISSVQSAYDNGTITNEDYEAKIAVVKAALIAAVKAQTTVGSDWTLLITNPSFESDFSGWTNSEMDTQINDSFTLKEGSKYVEKWLPNGTFSVSQTIKAMPTGVYRISAAAFARDVTSAKIQAGGLETAVTIGGDAANYSVEFACDDNADITIGFEGVGTGVGASWLCVDNFTMTLVSAGLPDVVAVDGKMNADVAQAQTEAIATYNNDKTVANYNAASEAITAAQASKDAYTAAATYIAKAKDVKTNQNFASATAITTFADAIEAIETPYNNNTLTTEAAAAAGTTLGVAATDWRANPNGAAVQYMNDGFSITGYVNNSLYVNTWSTEGSTDGSDFTVPFYEYWNSDANSLAQRTWTGTLTGLPNGQYMVQLLVRARIKDDANDEENMPSQATGLSIDINGYEGVNFSNNMIVLGTRFRMAECLVVGLVKDGVLNLNINVAAENNISWLSFKNVKYTKIRDLEPDEMAVAPADLVLDATKTIFKGKTATLTPTSTTEGASIDGYVTWVSDNTNVATVENGVVTAVDYGTANITATSTLNAEANATCAVTVTAPAITEAENLDFAEGPVATTNVVTYDKDKGTGKAQMQEVTGWSFGVDNGDAKAGAVMAYGSSYGLGSTDIYAPATNPASEVSGNALGIVAVWSASVQYIQDVKLPAGAYTITIPIYRNGGNNALSKNLIGVILDDGKEYLASTTTYTANEWTTETIQFVIDEETYGKLSIGYNAQNVGGGSSQRLWIDGISISLEPFATTDDYAALNQAIQANDNKTLGFLEGEYAPYTNVEILEKLAAAKAIDQTANNAQSAVQSAATALAGASWTANTEEVNAFFDGSFEHDYSALSGNVQPLGWYRVEGTYSGDGYNVRYVSIPGGVEGNTSNHGLFGKFTMMYGKETGYSLPLKAGVYSLSFMYGGWNETGSRILKLYNDDNEATIVPTNTVTAANNTGHTTASSWRRFDCKITVPADGDYVLSFYRENTTSQNQIVVTDLKMFSVPESSATLAVTAAKYGTFIAPFDVTLPEGVTAYTVTDGEQLTLTEVTNNIIPANTPVVVSSEEVVSESVSGYSLAIKDSYTVEALTGTYVDIDAPNGSYVLQNQNGKVGFYKVDTKVAQPKVRANRAYLSSGSNARSSFLFEDSETVTAINAVKALTEGEALIYDMNGVQQPRLKKGMNIIRTKDGRTQKVMVR